MGEVVSRKYSNALFEAAVEENSLESTRAELARFASLYSEAESVLLAPAVSKSDKRAILETMQLSGLVAGFAGLLLEKDRLAIVRDVKDDFDDMADERSKIAKAVVKTVVPLSEKQKSDLKSNLETATGLNIKLDIELDPTIIGGIVVRIGDKVLDGSVKSKLENMLESIREIK